MGVRGTVEPLEQRQTQHGPMGFSYEGYTHVTSLYTDDVLVFISHQEHFVPALPEIITAFEYVSGLRVNHRKSVLFPLASLARSTTKALPQTRLDSERSHFRYLGLVVSHTDPDN
ncbi:hypothetical protein NDU88_004494 [Pleurodeles waltl]|uniref:Reverse transcriptase domain-containing protein n=1 Tax=Pleurodeles waltl TaxID=8319 RepID=A0AAV7W9W6_PLEWA|nr:hypothetical protein NDU88_004494 [Pleurodeles waltl]